MVTAERLPHPPMVDDGPFRLLVRLVRTDLRATPSQRVTLRRFATVGDTLADAVVAERSGALLDAALAHDLDEVPPALAAFVDALEAEPVWLDHDALDRAARAMARTGLVGVYGPLSSVALMGGYLAFRPDKVLVRTGELHERAPGRMAETARWWVEVTTPGALAPGAAGQRAVAHVRLTHAHVRAALAARDDWDHERWDLPINQVHLAGTLTLFSGVFTASLRALGVRFDRRERRAVFHFWRYVGHLLGVDAALLPTDEADTWRLLWLEAVTEFEQDDDARLLAQALLGAIPATHGVRPGGAAERALVALHGSLGRVALGRANADHLGLPDSRPGRAGVAAVAVGLRAAELARVVVPGATALATRVGDRQRRRAVAAMAERVDVDPTYRRAPVGQVRTRPVS